MNENDIMPYNYFKAGGIFNGNINNLRYLIKINDNKLIAAVWKGPYRYDAVKDELKIQRDFEMSEEGLSEIIKWINEEYEKKRTQWDARIDTRKMDESLAVEIDR